MPNLHKDQQELIAIATEKKNEASEVFEQHQKMIDIKKKTQENQENNYRDKILAAIPGIRRLKGENFEEKYGSMTFDELMTEFNIAEPSAGDSTRINRGQFRQIGKANAWKMKKNNIALKKQIKEMQAKRDTLSETSTTPQKT